jgi:Tfp pilus tip-associated adhesin PilY1
VIYVGDMGGNLWKWSIHNPGEDPILDPGADRTQPNWPFKKFFTAAPATVGTVDYYKNIMYPPAVAYKGGAHYIAFGTGERRNLTFGGDDSDTAENNRFFVMIDSDPYETASPALGTITEADLTDFSGSAAAQAFVNKGFYFELVDGEKFVTNVEIFAGQVIAATFAPTESDDPCATRGRGTLYVFDLQTGGGYFDDGAGGSERWLDIGAGLPTDPKVSYGNPTKLIIEGQNEVDVLEGPEPDLNGATLFWREND